ncbi:RNA-guided endonuclease InsQ/TnpB family protein [Streptomyces sp. NPDC055815]
MELPAARVVHGSLCPDADARRRTAWLRDGSSVPHQQVVRDFGKARAKAQKDIRDRLPMNRRAGVPRWKRRREALPSLNCTRRGFRLKDGRLHLAGGIVLTVVWSRDLPEPAKGKPGSNGYKTARRQAAKLHKKIARQRQDTARKWAKSVVRDHDALAVEDFRPKFLAKTTMAKKAADAAIGATKAALVEQAHKHGRAVYLVHPAHTTMDCAQCGARTKHALPLSERTYTCTACGAVSPRDKNSARVMLVRAGLDPAGADRGSPGVALPRPAA